MVPTSRKQPSCRPCRAKALQKRKTALLQFRNNWGQNNLPWLLKPGNTMKLIITSAKVAFCTPLLMRSSGLETHCEYPNAWQNARDVNESLLAHWWDQNQLTLSYKLQTVWASGLSLQSFDKCSLLLLSVPLGLPLLVPGYCLSDHCHIMAVIIHLSECNFQRCSWKYSTMDSAPNFSCCSIAECSNLLFP